jgi:hypothetical protein
LPTLKVSESKVNNPKQKTQLKLRGYCIRCEERIDFKPTKPYCGSCFSTWAQYENPDYVENVCHLCGEYEETSMNKPLDYDCFKELQKELKKIK